MSARSLPAAHAPEGFRYVPGFLSERGEQELLALARRLDYEPLVMRGVASRRQIAHFGSRYSFESYALEAAPPMPPELERLRDAAAQLAGEPAEALSEALVAWYPPGAGIGWHRDAPPFGPTVIGLSLASGCRMRLRHPAPDAPDRWEVFVQPLEPRSLYVLSGPARARWQHSIPPVGEERFSVTFRTLRRRASPASDRGRPSPVQPRQ